MFVIGIVLISLQLPFCPYRFLSSEWVNRLELGRKFLVPVVLQAYGVSSLPKNNQASIVPKGFVSVKVSYALPEQECSETKIALR